MHALFNFNQRVLSAAVQVAPRFQDVLGAGQAGKDRLREYCTFMIETHWDSQQSYYDLQIAPVRDASARFTLLLHAMQKEVLNRVDHVRWIKPLRTLVGERAYTELLHAGYLYAYIIPDFDTIHELKGNEDKLFVFHAATNFGRYDTCLGEAAKREWALALDMERQALPFLLQTGWNVAVDGEYHIVFEYSFLEFEPYPHSPFEFPNLVMEAYRLGSTPKDWHFEALGASDSKAWALVMAYRCGLTPVDRHFDLFGNYAPNDWIECLEGRFVDVCGISDQLVSCEDEDVPVEWDITHSEIVEWSTNHYGLPIAVRCAWVLGLKPRWSHLQCLASDKLRLPMVTEAIEEGFLKLSREGIIGGEDCEESDGYLRGLAATVIQGRARTMLVQRRIARKAAVCVIEAAYERWMYRPSGARAAEGAARFGALAAEERAAKRPRN